MKTARWVLVLSSVASLMVALDALVVSTALGAIRSDLHASIDALEWTVNAYGLSFAVLLVTPFICTVISTSPAATAAGTVVLI